MSIVICGVWQVLSVWLLNCQLFALLIAELQAKKQLSGAEAQSTKLPRQLNVLHTPLAKCRGKTAALVCSVNGGRTRMLA